jgi:hypothetical protein
MCASPDPAAQRHGLTAKLGPGLVLVFAATSVAGCLAGCGDVTAMADAATSAGGDAPANPCGPNSCLLSDDFGGVTLNTSMWGVAMGGGGTVTESNGVLTLRLPAVANAYADVYSLVGFPSGTTFEAKVTFSAGQFYDHKGAGFASARVGSGCDMGETDAAMFRGQDGDGYVETKVSGNTPTCTLTTRNYPEGASIMQVSRLVDRVLFRQNNGSLDPIMTNVPMGLLPVRFSAYTFTTAPAAPVQIDIDYVRVSRP